MSLTAQAPEDSLDQVGSLRPPRPSGIAEAIPENPPRVRDIQMPVLDGFAATRKIREGSAQPAVPVVALTAQALTGERERCLSQEMNAYIPKPFRPQELSRWSRG